MKIIKDDYISKLEAVRLLQKAYAGGRIQAKDGCVSLLDDINALPSADVQPVRHGRWINHRINDEKSLLHGAIKDTTCSECGKSTPYKTDYCMHCGARMDGDSE